MENRFKRAFYRDMTGHVLAVLILVGFFCIAFAVFFGYVDIKDPAVISIVSSTIGYAAGNLRPVLGYYFHNGERDEKQEDKG